MARETEIRFTEAITILPKEKAKILKQAYEEVMVSSTWEYKIKVKPVDDTHDKLIVTADKYDESTNFYIIEDTISSMAVTNKARFVVDSIDTEEAIDLFESEFYKGNIRVIRMYEDPDEIANNLYKEGWFISW